MNLYEKYDLPRPSFLVGWARVFDMWGRFHFWRMPNEAKVAAHRQRELDDVFGRALAVVEAERVLRAARSKGADPG